MKMSLNNARRFVVECELNFNILIGGDDCYWLVLYTPGICSYSPTFGVVTLGDRATMSGFISRHERCRNIDRVLCS